MRPLFFAARNFFISKNTPARVDIKTRAVKRSDKLCAARKTRGA